MFDPTQVVIDAFENEVVAGYRRAFATPDPAHEAVLRELVRVSLDTLSGTDAPYHDMHHSLLVTLVGQEILIGRQAAEGSVTSQDWLHFVASTLCHDIGYVRGICRADRNGAYDSGRGSDPVLPPPGATDAWMSPWHVDRGKRFVHERFGNHPLLDADVLARNIEYTRFPVPETPDYEETASLRGLVRAADLIGQLADPLYVRKMSRLYAEFLETGEAQRLGFADASALRAEYPGFFWNVVRPHIDAGLAHLQRSTSGRIWVARLYAHVFAEEHQEPAFGPERRSARDRREQRMRLPPGTERRTSDPGRRVGDAESAATPLRTARWEPRGGS